MLVGSEYTAVIYIPIFQGLWARVVMATEHRAQSLTNLPVIISSDHDHMRRLNRVIRAIICSRRSVTHHRPPVTVRRLHPVSCGVQIST